MSPLYCRLSAANVLPLEKEFYQLPTWARELITKQRRNMRYALETLAAYEYKTGESDTDYLIFMDNSSKVVPAIRRVEMHTGRMQSIILERNDDGTLGLSSAFNALTVAPVGANKLTISS
jgi:hypothetical protein